MLIVVPVTTIAAFVAGIFAGDYLTRGKRELFDQPSGDVSNSGDVIVSGSGHSLPIVHSSCDHQPQPRDDSHV